jgi:hypothetical protein
VSRADVMVRAYHEGCTDPETGLERDTLIDLLMAQRAEHVTLVGPFAHRKPPRHAPRDRFQNWRVRIRAAQLAKVYAQLSLLAGFGGAP